MIYWLNGKSKNIKTKKDLRSVTITTHDKWKPLFQVSQAHSFHFRKIWFLKGASQVVLVVKNLTANAWDIGDAG